MMDDKLILDKPKNTLKFVWRHVLTLGCLVLAMYAFIFTNPIVIRVLITLCIAGLLDWAKQFIKFTPNNARRHSALDFLEQNNRNNHGIFYDNDSNPSVIGTSAYLRHSGNRYN